MTKKDERVDVIEEIEVHGVLPEDDSHIFMVHTHGMEKYELPNLLVEASEIFTYVATSLLNSMCDWLINDVKKANLDNAKSDPVVLRGLPNMEFIETVYDGEKVWKLTPTEKVECACCNISDGKPEGVTTH
jgi:hypothetical protein